MQVQKAIAIALWVLVAGIVVAVFVIRPGHNAPAGKPPIPAEATLVSDPMPAFSATDQEDRPFTDRDLPGHVWIADFIFTRCQGPCPRMTDALADVAKRIADPRVRMLSFSVDPENDRPAVLKRYAADHGADPNRWIFLTGTTQMVQDVAKGMKVAASPAQPGRPIGHDTHFVLIDSSARIRGYYASNDEQDIQRLIKDATALTASATTRP